MRYLYKAIALAAFAILMVAGLAMNHTTSVGAASYAPQSGQEIHRQHCMRCHGPGGKGDGPAAKLLNPKPANWTDKGRMGALSNSDLFNIIKNGGASAGKSKLMPAFGGKLSDEEINNVIAFIRSL